MAPVSYGAPVVLPRFAGATVAAGQQPGGWLDESYALTRPCGTGGAYPNFPEPGLPDEAYYLGNTGRLRRIRSAYDPSAVFTPSVRIPGEDL